MNPRSPRVLFLGLLAALSAACNSGSGSSGGGTVVGGELLQRPDTGALFLSETHQRGSAGRLSLIELNWGRLVDVYALDGSGQREAAPRLRDFAVRETLTSDGVNYTTDTDPFTGRTTLLVHRRVDEAGFAALLRQASTDLPIVQPKSDDGSSPAPFSYLARNATLVLRFDDLLKDGPEERLALASMIRLRVGYPPVVPFEARFFFDPNHGGLSGGSFHSTRVLVDLTLSPDEGDGPGAFDNPIGLPASLPGNDRPNVSVRIPTRIVPGQGVLRVLTNLSGGVLRTSTNGPADLGSATLDIVRALRSGNATDLSNGFLVDDTPPAIVGTWGVNVSAAAAQPDGALLDLVFPSACARAPRAGDRLQIAGQELEVLVAGSAPDPVTGAVSDVLVRLDPDFPTTAPPLGAGLYLTRFEGGTEVPSACWIRFVPPPDQDGFVSPDAQVTMRFTEALDPVSVRPYDGFQLIRGDAQVTPAATNTVIGTVAPAAGFREHTFQPRLSLTHDLGASETYHLRLGEAEEGPTDLAGNPLLATITGIEFGLAPEAPTRNTGSFVLRFDTIDEYAPPGSAGPDGLREIRGQIQPDVELGLLRPRPVVRRAWPIDANNPVPALMFPLPVGIPTPLSPLGGKVMALWRYMDAGWLVDDESLYDIDVEGLDWAPFGAQVSADFFEGFEIRLAHSNRLPDEYMTTTGLVYPNSGLLDQPNLFTNNVLADPRNPLTVVHARANGYRVDPADLTLTSTGLAVMPFPLNRGVGPRTTYTWRDTTIVARGGSQSGGIPSAVEASLGMYDGAAAGDFDAPGEVPSYGLPLLMQLSCYPSNSGLGVNNFSLAVARFTQIQPTLRLNSTGGFNQAGQRVTRDPDLQTVPSGGFDPTTTPPGAPTLSADPGFYYGQLHTVTRLSRACTIWFDTESPTARLEATILEPAVLPDGTAVRIEARGAQGFAASDGAEVDATRIDPYGELRTGSVSYLDGDPTWKADLSEVQGARFVQFRLTFEGNLETGIAPELSTLAVAFER